MSIYFTAGRRQRTSDIRNIITPVFIGEAWSDDTYWSDDTGWSSAAPVGILVSRWPLDSSAVDSQGVSNGSDLGAPTYNQQPLEATGQSALFDRTDDAIVVAHAPEYQTQNWAFHCKVQPSSVPTGTRTILSKGANLANGEIAVVQQSDGLNAYVTAGEEGGGSGILFNDTFTGSALALTDPGYVPNTGTGWTNVLMPVGTALQRNGSGVCAPTVAVVDTRVLVLASPAMTSVDQSVFFTVGALSGSATSRVGVVLGYNSSNGNGYALFASADQLNMRAYRLTGNSPATVLSVDASAPGAGDEVEFRRIGTTFTIWKNGVQVGTFTDATHTHAGSCGLIGGAFVQTAHDWDITHTITAFRVQSPGAVSIPKYWQGPGGSSAGVAALQADVAYDIVFQGGSGGTELWHRTAGGSWALVGSNTIIVSLMENTADLYIARSAYGGQFFGGFVDNVEFYNYKLAPSDLEDIPPPISRAPIEAPTGFFISTTGSDSTGDGSLANPWRTAPFGMSQLSPGQTLWARGGRYSGDFTISASGTSANPITLESYPGEIAIFDVNNLAFQTPGSGAWEIDPSAPAETEVYRSVATTFGAGGNSRGTFWVNDEAVGLVLSGMRPYSTLAMIRSTTYEATANFEYYSGPGFCFNGGRVYIRIQNLASPRDAGLTSAMEVNPLGDLRNHPPSSGGFNPNDYEVWISEARECITVTGSFVTLRRLAVYGGQYGVNISGGAHHITVERCRLWGATHPMTCGTPSNNDTMRRCHVQSGFSPCFSWAEVHTWGAEAHPRMESKIWSGSGSDTDILIEENRIVACFDGFSGVGSNTRNLRLIRNEINFLFDDLIQFNGQATFEVGWNYVRGPGPGYNGNDSGTATASKFVHHNVFDDRRGEFGWRWNIGALAGSGPGPTPWRQSHVPFATHSVFETGTEACITPMKMYNNTILYRGNINAQGSRMQRIGSRTAGLHEVYNNIAIGFSANCYARDFRISATDQIHDYQVIHKVGNYSVACFRDMGTPDNDFATLALFRASAFFNDSKSVYAPGFEANSKEGDPGIPSATMNSSFGAATLNYRPSTSGLAATGGKQLLSTGWPGADNAGYIGAVAPNASTNLGGVGIPPGTAIGP